MEGKCRAGDTGGNELLISLKTAKSALSWVPPMLLAFADEVVE
jgi:hypothetical protein